MFGVKTFNPFLSLAPFDIGMDGTLYFSLSPSSGGKSFSSIYYSL